MKCRLSKSALPAMKIALTGEKSLTEQPLRALQRATFDEVRIVSYENIANVIRMVGQEHMLAAHVERRQVSIFFRKLLKKR